MKVVLFGNKASTQFLGDYLIGKGNKIDSLVTLSQSQKDKTQISGVSNSLERWALENNIEVYNPSSYSMSGDEDKRWFAEKQFDIGLCLGWQRLIPNSILGLCTHGVFGWHGSGFEFPNGRGRSPINWSIRLGLKQIYHNCFKYSDGADDGSVFETKYIEIGELDHVADIQGKALEHIKSSSVNLLEAARSGQIVLQAQSSQAYISLPKLTELDGWLQPSLMTKTMAFNIVRSCSSPFPGAYIYLRSQDTKIRIWRLSVSKEHHGDMLSPGAMQIARGMLRIGFVDGECLSQDFEILSGAWDDDQLRQIHWV